MTREEAAALGRSAWEDIKRSRMDDYLHIGGDRIPAREAARRLGVSARTVNRYRAELRKAAQS